MSAATRPPPPALDLRERPARYRQLVFGRHAPRGEEARRLEQRVFEASFGMTAVEHALHYDAYDDASTFLGVLDTATDEVVGVLRLVLPSAAGLCSAADIRRTWRLSEAELVRPGGGVLLDLADCWDAATLAVAPEHRNGMVSCALYQSVCMLAQGASVTWLLSILDVEVHALLDRFVAGLMTPFELPPRSFAGSVSIPVWSNVPARRAWLQRNDPATFALLSEGAPMAGVEPADWSSLLAEVTPRSAPTPV